MDVARNRRSRSAAASASFAPIAEPAGDAVGSGERQVRAGTASDRGTTRHRASARSTAAARVDSSPAPSVIPSHRARGRPTGGKAPAPWIGDVKGGDLAADAPDRIGGRFDAVVQCGTQEPERQVQAVEADPADVASAARDAVCPDAIHQRRRPRRSPPPAAGPR